MNLLNLLPKKLQENYIKNLRNAGIEKDPYKYFSKNFLVFLIVSLVIGVFVYVLGGSVFLGFILSFFILEILYYMRISMKASSRVGEMEKVFPDFLQLMSSNLRAGMTVERAFISSARPELSPLNEEIRETGRDVATGKDISVAFRDMAKRIDSEEINNIVSLIISGLRTGG